VVAGERGAAEARHGIAGPVRRGEDCRNCIFGQTMPQTRFLNLFLYGIDDDISERLRCDFANDPS